MTPLDVLVRVSIVLSAAWGLAILLRRRPAALRHWVLAAGIVCAAVAPALTVFAPAWHLPARAAARESTATSTVVVNATAEAAASQPQFILTRQAIAHTTPTPRRLSLTAAAGWLWIAGAAVGLMTLAIGLMRLAWIAARAEPFHDERWSTIQEQVARAYGLSRRATLLQTERPLLMTWGVLAPKIVVPRGAAAWPDGRIRVVLAHELAHVVRGDWLTQLAAEFVRAAHWCNPLAWIVCRGVRVESEHACDDAVLNLGVAGSEYASHLLDLARTMHTRRHAWVPAQAIVRPSSLERRVAAMLNARLNHAPLSRAGRLAAAVALALVTVLAAGFSAAQGSTITGTVTDQLGHPIANLALSLVDLTTNAPHQATTDSTGRYEITGLTSGDYMLTVATPGFEKVEARLVLANASLQRDVQLQLGRIQETIFVVDGPPTPMPDSKRAFVPTPQTGAKPIDKAAPGTPLTPEKRALIQAKVQKAASAPCPTGGGCIVPPIKLIDHKPVFPDSQVGMGGVVTLTGLIDATGHVSNLQVVGTANPDLAQAAVAAVSQWEFEPTRLDGQVVDTLMNVSVTFKPSR